MHRKNRLIPGSYTIMFLLLTLASMALAFGGPSSAAAADTVKADVVSDYTIGPEDVLEVSVWRNEDLSKVVIVRPDGYISLPLIGDIRASGMTPEELKGVISAKLKKYQETVVVSVIVQEANSYKVYILGEVLKPGEYLLKRKTTLQQLVALAGGFTQFASKNKIMVTRHDPTSQGSPEKMKVRFDDLVYENLNPLFLKPGDTVYVP